MTDQEKLLLGTAKLGGNWMTLVIDKVGEEALSTEASRSLFSRMKEQHLSSGSVSVDLLAAAAKKDEEIEALSQIIPVADPANLERIIRDVNDGYVYRSRRGVVSMAASSPGAIDAGKLKRQLDEIDAYVSRGLLTQAELAARILEAAKDRKSSGSTVAGRLSGIKGMDDAFYGFRDGLHVIGARPGTGKTSLMLGMQTGFQSYGEKTGFISLEMTQERIGFRLAAAATGLDSNSLAVLDLDEEEIEQFESWVRSQEENTSVIECPRNKSTIHLEDLILRMVLAGCKVIMVDYLQLVTGKMSKPVAEAAKICSDSGRNYGVTVVAASQVRREVEDTKMKIPTIRHMAEASEIENYSETIQLLWRPSQYSIKKASGGEFPDTYVKSFIGKNRESSRKRPIHLKAIGGLRWEECSDPEEDP